MVLFTMGNRRTQRARENPIGRDAQTKGHIGTSLRTNTGPVVHFARPVARLVQC